MTNEDQDEELKVLMLLSQDSEALHRLLPNFEKTYGIKVDFRTLPHQHLYSEILAEHYGAKQDCASDVYMFDTPWLSSLAADGILAELTDLFVENDYSADHFLPNCMKYFGEFRNRIFGLPFMYAPQIFYYRKNLFEDPTLQQLYHRSTQSNLKPPITWTEFNTLAAFFTNSKSRQNTVEYGTSVPGAYAECAVPEIYLRMRFYNAKIFDRNMKVVFDSPQTLKAYVSYKSLLSKTKPNYLESNDLTCAEDFVRGETAMVITYPSFLTNKMDLRLRSLIGNIGYTQVPGRAPILGGWSLGINSMSSQKENAFKFIRWATSEDNANYFTVLGCQPLASSIYENDELTTLYPWLSAYREAFKIAKPILPIYKREKPIIPQEEINRIIYDGLVEMYFDRMEIQDVLRKTDLQLNNLLKNYGY